MGWKMFSSTELDNWLELIGSKIKEHIKIYIIGGGALSFRGLKEATKDVDIIIKNQKEFDLFDETVKNAGFKLMTNIENEFYLTALAVYIKEDSRIDVFLKEVGKMLTLTQSMIERAEHYKDYEKLSVYLLSNEDIFLFKLMTERAGDIFDCDRLMKEELNYNIIYNEALEQSKGRKWFFWAYESLCKLEEHNGIRIPIKGKVFSLVKEYWKDRPSDFMADIENLEKHIPDKKLLKDLKK